MKMSSSKFLTLLRVLLIRGEDSCPSIIYLDNTIMLKISVSDNESPNVRKGYTGRKKTCFVSTRHAFYSLFRFFTSSLLQCTMLNVRDSPREE